MGNPANLRPQPFKKNDKRINRKGRPRKLVSHILKDLEKDGYKTVSASQIRDVYLFLMNLPIGELNKIAGKGTYYKELINGKEEIIFTETDKDYPFLIRAVAKAMIQGKGLEIIEKMNDRAIGQARQPMEITGIDGNPLFPITQIQIIENPKNSGNKNPETTPQLKGKDKLLGRGQ